MDWERERGGEGGRGQTRVLHVSGRTLYCVLTLVSFFLKENSRGKPENVFVHIQQCLRFIEVT